MNKLSIVKISLILIVSLMQLTSCQNEIDNLFDESSALRMQHALEQYSKTLSDTPNGWVMDYFPNDTVAGYPYLMKFSKDGSVHIAGKNKYLNNTYKEERSLYDLLSDNGPVLSFSTFNSLFHLFSYPEDPMGLNGDMSGVGLGGDYEFIILKTLPEFITLEGKKRRTHITLRRMEENVEWEDYIETITQMDKFLFDTRVPFLNLNLPGNKKYEAYNGTKHLFRFILPGDDMISKSTLLPFVVTPNGLRFHRAFKDEITEYTSNAYEFVYDSEKQLLVCSEDPTITITPPARASYLEQSTSVYMADKTQMSGQFAAIFTKLAKDFEEVYKGGRDLVSIGFGSKDNMHTLVVKTTNSIANYTIPYSAANDHTIVIGGMDAENFPTDSMDMNASNFYRRIPSIKDLLALLPGEYLIETTVPFNLNEVSYIKSDDKESKITVSR